MLFACRQGLIPALVLIHDVNEIRDILFAVQLFVRRML
jgi:hypothetical protein